MTSTSIPEMCKRTLIVGDEESALVAAKHRIKKLEYDAITVHNAEGALIRRHLGSPF